MKRLYEDDAYARHVGSWWETTARPEPWPKLARDMRADTVIIGAGYTGLNCALELAERFAIGAIVLIDAQHPGWGASGRNGGFACMGGGKLDFDGHIRRFGEAETRNYFNAQIAAVDSVRENLARYKIDAETHSDGETQLAHRAKDAEALAAEREMLIRRLGIEAQFIPGEALRQHGLASPEFHAALSNPIGFALNPMKYVAGLTRAIRKADLAAFGDTPATRIAHSSLGWQVTTPGGTVTADNLVIATNGYSSENLPDWMSGRLLPVLTNIIVTRPITDSELAAQGWTSHQMCYDTRNLLHYFRLMPTRPDEAGPRMLFGMRGGVRASARSQAAMQRRIRADFERVFPAWRGVETQYFWSGLACLTRDLTSFIGPIPEHQNAYASLAYHGNGVAFGSYSGRMLAKIIAGERAPTDLPAAMRQPPRRFPLPALRRAFLSAAYKWYDWQDR